MTIFDQFSHEEKLLIFTSSFLIHFFNFGKMMDPIAFEISGIFGCDRSNNDCNCKSRGNSSLNFIRVPRTRPDPPKVPNHFRTV